MKAPGNAGRWLAAALIVVIAVAEVAEVVRAGGANRRPSAIQGATAAAGLAASNRPLGIPHDWSHRHLIFSRPASPEAARRLERDPRYQIQQAWRHRQAVAGSAEAYMQSLDAMAVQLASAHRSGTMPRPKGKKPKLPVGAWGESLNVTVSNANGNANYPAKFAFTSSTSCSDWVVFTVPIAGSSTQFSIFAFNNLYSSVCSPTPKLKFSYNASNSSGPLATAPVISLAGDQVAFVEKAPTAHFNVLRFADVGTPLPTFPNPTSLTGCTN
ncbi:MAG TPA: hypothetical protein VFE56_12655, partial [Candidatus Binataceae bacterium]|nr:hypothetical protein [Candidatus Binataceae bacterium]